MNDESVYARPVALAGNNLRTAGEVEIKKFSKRARIWNAMWRGAAGLLVTAVMAAIPIAHFILVPLGLVVTAMMVFSAYGREEMVIGGSGLCPYCNERLSFVQRTAKFPFLERCGSCFRECTVDISN